ncbi:hypothetical protein [Metapseudomonas furukawaii]
MIGEGGDCHGGRILSYLKAMLCELRRNVLFVGYQSQDTRARFKACGPQGGHVELDEQRYDIRAQLNTMGDCSVNAGQKGLGKS